MTAIHLLASAIEQHRAGDLAGARRRYRQTLALEPDHVDALNGHAAGDLATGSARPARQLLARASAVAPTDVRVAVNACLAAADLGVVTPGMLARALTVAPSVAVLMDILSGVQERAQALAWNSRAGATEVSAVRLLRLGRGLVRVGDRSKGRRALRRAVARAPAMADALNGSGSADYDDGDVSGGSALFRRALACDPFHAAAWSNLALAHHDLGRLTAAIAASQRALALDPALPDAHTNHGNASLEAVSPSVAVADYRRALAIASDRPAFLSNLLMALAYVAGAAEEQAATAAAWWRRLRIVASTPTLRLRRRPQRRLRVGYVSTFSLASTRHLGLAAIARHRPDDIEVFAYRQNRRGPPQRLDLGPAFAAERNISALDDVEAARLIREDRIDVLVDLAGHTPGNRLGVFALRPAAVQATWIESFFTTGLTAIDWFLTDALHSPPALRQPFVENLIRLERPRFCYSPPTDAPDLVPPPSEHKGLVTFGCFNYPPKIGNEVVALWASILAEMPTARLRLKWWSMTEPKVAEATRTRFERHGVASDRLDLVGASPHRRMLAEYGDVDVALDPFPFTGGATTCEALWMGVPVVSLCGTSVIERQSASLLRSVGASDLVATDMEEYRMIALAAAADGAGRAARRSELRAAMAASPLTDAADMARKLEAAYRQMVEQDGKEG